jgi:hypothetical protein
MDIEEHRPVLIDFGYVAEFMQQQGLITKKSQASSAASDLWLKLMDGIPEISFVCKRCEESRGVCCCRQHGSRIGGGEWSYRSYAAPWQCRVESLLDLDVAKLRKLGPKTRARTLLLIQHLSELPE